MMKKIILFALIFMCFPVLKSYSQFGGISYTRDVKVSRNNPKLQNRLHFGVNPLNGFLYTLNPFPNYELSAQYQFDRIHVKAAFTKSYPESIYGDLVEEAPVGLIYSFDLKYKVRSTLRNIEYKTYLYSTKRGDKTVRHSLHQQAKGISNLIIRAGYFHSEWPISVNYSSSLFRDYYFEGYLVDYPDVDIKRIGGKADVHMNCLYLGISWMGDYDIKFEYNDRVFDKKYQQELYFDVFYAPQIHILNGQVETGVFANGEIHPVDDRDYSHPLFLTNQAYNLEETKRSPFGVRAGYEFKSLRKVGTGCTAEFGFFPGLWEMERNLYVSLKYEISLSFLSRENNSKLRER